MKRIIVALILLAMIAAMSINCFAADISTAVTDLDLIYFDDFSDDKKYDYGASENYIAEIDGQSLYLMSAGSDYTAYMLPGAPELSGLSKITFVYAFSYDMYVNMREVAFRFGMTDETDGFLMGVTPDNSNGMKTYYAPIEAGKNAKASLSLGTCRRYGYMYTSADAALAEDATQRIKEFPTDRDSVWTIVVEFEVGSEPVTSFYLNGEPQDWYMAEPGGNKEYSISADTDVTLNGKLGFVIKAGGILLDGVAVYGTTGLDHRELVAKVSTEGGVAGSDTPATEAPTTDAPVTDAPVTEAPVTEAPATDAPATDAPETEAPATDAPATDAPATDAPTTEAPKDDKGCGGVIGIGAIVAILGTAVVLKKRD